MKRLAPVILCVMALAALIRASSRETAAVPAAGDLGEDEKVAGLSRIWMEAAVGFPRFADLPDLDWDASYLAFLPRVRATRTPYEYYTVLRAFTAQLRSGHTDVALPAALRERMEAEPPVRLDLIENRVVVTRVDSPSLVASGVAPGLELTAVDGEDVHARADRRRPFVASDSPQHLRVQLYSHGLLAGPRDVAVDVMLRHRDGVTVHRSVQRTGYVDVVTPEPFVYRDLPGRVALVEIDTFDAGVQAAFDAHAGALRQASGVIVDVRQNEGGSGQVAFDILAAFMDQDFETTRWKSRSYVPTLRAWGQKGAWFEPEPARWHAAREPIRVPVVLLTGPRSVSATDVFAETFQRLHRGPVIGEPTGGSIGDPISIHLPGGGYARIATSTSALVGRGVIPDIAVPRTVQDVQTRHDAALIQAQEWLNHHR